MVTAALRAVGNIVTGDDEQTQVILNCDALPSIKKLLNSDMYTIKKEACWTISNITAGNREQIQAVISANIFPLLIRVMQTADFKTRKEAAWAITNATSSGTAEQIRYLVCCFLCNQKAILFFIQIRSMAGERWLCTTNV